MLNSKVSIVTGGASGIGLAVAKMLSKEGSKVVIADISEAQLVEVSKELNCDYYVSDLSKRDACKALVDYTIEKYSKVDILVNVAGVQNVSSI